VAARLGSNEASEAATAITQAMSRTTNYQALAQLALGLSAVSARLGSKEAAAVCGQAAATLSQAMTRTAHGGELYQLARGLSAVSDRLEPGEAGQAAAILSQTMSRTTNPGEWYPLALGLSAVAARLEPREATAVCGQAAAILSQVMVTKTTKLGEFYPLAWGLAAVAARLEPKEAGEVAATLTQAMARTTNTYVLRFLAQGLSAVAARLEPKEAAAVCGQAAATISQAMSRTTNEGELQNLAQVLSAVAGRLEPKEAAETAATLTQAMAKMPGFALQPLVQGLSAVLLREDASRSAQRRKGVSGAVGVLSSPGSVLVAPVLLQPALKPLPPPLPAQTLVDLLKQPFCVGEARRLVLDQLQRHYQRPFADQWEFVDQVHQQKLGFDLTTPPERPRLLANKE
jgi:hypothetical protein